MSGSRDSCAESADSASGAPLPLPLPACRRHAGRGEIYMAASAGCRYRSTPALLYHHPLAACGMIRAGSAEMVGNVALAAWGREAQSPNRASEKRLQRGNSRLSEARCFDAMRCPHAASVGLSTTAASPMHHAASSLISHIFLISHSSFLTFYLSFFILIYYLCPANSRRIRQIPFRGTLLTVGVGRVGHTVRCRVP